MMNEASIEMRVVKIDQEINRDTEITSDHERRALFLRYINRGWLIFGLVTLISMPFNQDQRIIYMYLYGLALSTYLLVRLLNNPANTRAAGIIFTVAVDLGLYGLFLLLVREMGAEEAFRSQMTVWMLMGLAVLFAASLLDRRAGFVLAGVNSLLLIATRLVLAPAADPRPSALVFWWMIALVIWLYERTLQSALAQALVEIGERKRAQEAQRGLLNELNHAYDATIAGWARALELRDMETEGHSSRAAEMTIKLARRMGVQEDQLPHIRRGALLHDIGKMGIPDAILQKPGPLTEDEWKIMQEHPTHAYRWLARITFLREALDIPYSHHEKWDGSGYPRKLKGEQIPMAARIFAVVDTWDAVTRDRPYRSAWSESKALEYIREESGRQFDPQVVTAFLGLITGN